MKEIVDWLSLMIILFLLLEASQSKTIELTAGDDNDNDPALSEKPVCGLKEANDLGVTLISEGNKLLLGTLPQVTGADSEYLIAFLDEIFHIGKHLIAISKNTTGRIERKTKTVDGACNKDGECIEKEEIGEDSSPHDHLNKETIIILRGYGLRLENATKMLNKIDTVTLESISKSVSTIKHAISSYFDSEFIGHCFDKRIKRVNRRTYLLDKNGELWRRIRFMFGMLISVPFVVMIGRG